MTDMDNVVGIFDKVSEDDEAYLAEFIRTTRTTLDTPGKRTFVEESFDLLFCEDDGEWIDDAFRHKTLVRNRLGSSDEINLDVQTTSGKWVTIYPGDIIGNHPGSKRLIVYRKL